MQIPCPVPCTTCTPFVGGASSPSDPDYPFVNLSSEEADVDDFIGRRYGPNPPGPSIGNMFYSIGCVGWCVSRVSQEDADLCAARQEILCLGDNWPQNPGTPPTPEPWKPPTFPPATIFANSPQSARFTCPDGSEFEYTVPAGTFFSFSQRAADESALSYANIKAAEQRLCVGELFPTFVCAGEEYSGEITASSANLPLTANVIGDLPEGLFQSGNPDSMMLTGIVNVPGDYAFSVEFTDTLNQKATKACSITFFGIVNDSSLPEATAEEPYSVTFVTAGTVTGDVTFSLSGVLPSGLTLNGDTGEISGTVDAGEEGEYNFTIRAHGGGLSCPKEFFLIVDSSSCGNPNIQWHGAPGLLAIGLDYTVANALMYNNAVVPELARLITGFWMKPALDVVGSIAVLTVQWGGPGLPWFIDCNAESNNWGTFGGMSTAYDDSTTKTLRVPVYTDRSNDEYNNAYVTTGTPSKVGYGDAICTVEYDCESHASDFAAIVWGPWIPNDIAPGVSTGSSSGSTFDVTSNNPDPASQANIQSTSTFVANSGAINLRLILTVTGAVIFDEDKPNFDIVATSNNDGTVWRVDTQAWDPVPWFTGDGVYIVPFVFTCTPGSTISLTIHVLSSGEICGMNLHGVFALW